MKKTILTLLIPILGSFAGYSQAELTVVAPTGAATTGLRAPNGTTAHTTMRGVIIVTAAELAAIPGGTTLTKLGFVLSQGATPGPAGGNIQMYLENTADVTNLKSTTWATTISTMTSVYNGSYTIPATTGNVDITMTTPFVYTGGSLYVAYDYLGSTFATTGAIYFANNLITGGWKGDVSGTTTPPATLTQSSAFRPNIRFSFTNPFTNELNVSGIAGEKGIFNNTIKTSQTVTSLISNTSQGALTNIPVTLAVTGANPYTVTQTIPSIAAGGTSTLLFNNVPTVNLGSQTLTISIPNDQDNANNSRTFTQKVQCDTISYVQTPVQSGGVGFNTGAGLIGVRHVIPNNIETHVKSVANYFPTAAANAGNTIKGILLDGNGVIIDSTALITITAGMLGTRQSFDFINGAIDVSGGTIYVGFRQTANATTGYFPFANQDNSYVDPNAAATFGLFGGGTSPLGSGLGYMMIEATLTFGGFDVANSSTAGTLCSNTALVISPTPGYANYEFFVDGSSVQNSATASYTTAPLTTTTTFNVDIMNGTCLLSSNLQTITIVTALVNDISAGICPGDSYTVGSSVYTAAGSYSDVLVSTSGCDSIVNLTLSLLAPTSSTLDASICPGDSYTFGSQVLTAAGTYTDVLTNAAGCDSTITLNLTLNATSSSSIVVNACATSYDFLGTILTASGTYTATIPNAAGCDSLITLGLTLNAPVSVTTSTSGIILTAAATPSNVVYQWIDCATSSPIAGETNMTFEPTVNGDYAVVVETPDGCTATSACASISTIGLDELNTSSTINVYPNPATTTVHAVSNGGDILSYTVVDAGGRVVLSESLEGGTKEVEFSVQSFENGAYILELKTIGGTITKPFVKK